MPLTAHAFRGVRGAGSGWQRPRPRSGGTRQAEFRAGIVGGAWWRWKRSSRDGIKQSLRNALAWKGRGETGITGVQQ